MTREHRRREKGGGGRDNKNREEEKSEKGVGKGMRRKDKRGKEVS